MRFVSYALAFLASLGACVEVTINSSFTFGWEYVDPETIHMTFTVTL